MRAPSQVPVTVKCRIGIDDQDSEARPAALHRRVARRRLRTFIVHARKAWLKGLSPKENREIPPLDYARVYRLKARAPDLDDRHQRRHRPISTKPRGTSQHVDGVMLGRAAYQTPYLLAEVDQRFFGANAAVPTRAEALDGLVPLCRSATSPRGGRLSTTSRGMFSASITGEPRARVFRRHLSENAPRDGAGAERRCIEAMRSPSASWRPLAAAPSRERRRACISRSPRAELVLLDRRAARRRRRGRLSRRPARHRRRRRPRAGALRGLPRRWTSIRGCAHALALGTTLAVIVPTVVAFVLRAPRARRGRHAAVASGWGRGSFPASSSAF